jgi:predicted transglutaminase-like cysteine proteinase
MDSVSADHYVPAPAGFVSFCIRFPDQCDAPAAEAHQFALSAERWRLLRRINTDVNRAIWPLSDEVHYRRREFWTIPTDGYGDCDDYVVTKRRNLIASGLPEHALRIAIVTSPQSGRHAVLVAATDRGDFVLDNLTDAIVERRQSAYAWLEQQDAVDPRAWVSLAPQTSDTRPIAVGAMK